MNRIIVITIIVLVLLYAASQVIPIGGIIVFAVGVGFSLMLQMRLQKWVERRKLAEQNEADSMKSRETL